MWLTCSEFSASLRSSSRLTNNTEHPVTAGLVQVHQEIPACTLCTEQIMLTHFQILQIEPTLSHSNTQKQTWTNYVLIQSQTVNHKINIVI